MATGKKTMADGEPIREFLAAGVLSMEQRSGAKPIRAYFFGRLRAIAPPAVHAGREDGPVSLQIDRLSFMASACLGEILPRTLRGHLAAGRMRYETHCLRAVYDGGGIAIELASPGHADVLSARLTATLTPISTAAARRDSCAAFKLPARGSGSRPGANRGKLFFGKRGKS
jgi:hypothetical protein